MYIQEYMLQILLSSGNSANVWFYFTYVRKCYSGFNTVFVPLLLLAAGVGFPAACF